MYLSKNPGRVCTFFAVDFDSQFGTELPKAVQEVRKEHKPTMVQATPFSYSLHWPAEGYLALLSFQRVYWQTLGLSAWQERITSNTSIIRQILRTMEIEDLNRIGFKVVAFLNLNMSHAELGRLMFGSYLAPAGDLFDNPTDPLVQLHGKRNGCDYEINVTGMTRDQISESFLHLPNLDAFRTHKLLDTTVKVFHDRIVEKDCLYLDIDLFKRDVTVGVLDAFIRDSLGLAEELADIAVRHLQSQPIEEKAS